jgi:hypothetical protein
MLWKRVNPRIAVDSLCSELVDDREHFGTLLDLSPEGVRFERPLGGRRESPIVQLEFELPEADEIVWAKGEVMFDRYGRLAPGAKPIRTTGVRLVSAATRHLRMLRDWVAATVEAQRTRVDDDVSAYLAFASHWRG